MALSQGAVYHSEVDSQLTIKKVLIYPTTDNIDGVYSRPMAKVVEDYISNNHHFDSAEPLNNGKYYSIEQLAGSKTAVDELFAGTDADSALLSRATKLPDGVELDFYLFTRANGRLLAKHQEKGITKFDTNRILAETKSGLDKVFSQVPYSGLVMSRNQNRVTLDVGKKDGVSNGEVVSAILIIKENRHPKFDFIVSTEKEVLGKIKLEKVEDTLSFGSIVSEKEPGAIAVDTKIGKLDMTEYKGGGFLAAPTPKDDLPPNVKKLTYGDNPKAWVPVEPPTFGSLNITLGFGSFTANSDLDDSGAVQAQENIFPQLKLDGELWITPEFSVLAGIRQGVMSIDNPLEGSEPETLNVSISQYSLLFGYNILVHGDFFGPKVQVLGGYSTYSRYVDSSNPLAITSVTYSGFLVGLDGTLPIDPEEKVFLGATLHLYIKPDLQEEPRTSGKESSNSITMFSFYGNYKIAERIKIRGAIDFELYSSSFEGSGTRSEKASSASERLISFNGGLQYLF
ncbi:MAG: hypothetical protein KDD25_03225 [Bdellovibrionales bacterium]|nr:hypothetical protein [Bdellovibrionales bacterium]